MPGKNVMYVTFCRDHELRQRPMAYAEEIDFRSDGWCLGTNATIDKWSNAIPAWWQGKTTIPLTPFDFVIGSINCSAIFLAGKYRRFSSRFVRDEWRNRKIIGTCA